MKDEDKTKQQLIQELNELRRRVTVLEDVDGGRRRAEEEAAKSKATLTVAIECLPFDFFALDPQGRCILQNALSRKYYGNALGKTAQDVCPDQRVLAYWLDGLHRALAGQRVEGEMQWMLAGERRSFSSFMAPIQCDGMLHGVLGVNVDITEQKRAEMALRASEARYRALAESTKDIIYILDRQGTLVYANPAASRCIGIPSADIVGKRQADLFPPEMAQAHIEKTQRVFATGEVMAEDELFHFGPEEVWLRIHLIPLRDEGGQIAAVMGVCHDITERKRAETALQESEKRLRAIFEQAPLGIALVDSHSGRFIQVNPKYCEIAGRTPAEMLSRDYQSISHPDDLPASRANMARLVKGEVPFCTWDKRYLRPDGSPVWVSITVVALWEESEHPRFHLTMVEDITQRKQAEEALRKAHDELERRVEQRTAELHRSKRWLEEAQRIARIGSWEWDVKTNEVLWSDEMYRLFGVSRDTFQVSFEEHLQLIPAEDRREYVAALERVLAGKEQWNREHRILLPDGKIRYVWAVGTARIDAQGKIIGLVGTTQDITQRKAAESALRQSHDELQAIYDGMVDGLNILDLGTLKAVRVNPALCRMMGYSQEEALQLTQAQVHPPEALPKIVESMRAHVEGRAFRETDMPHLRKDGSIFYADIGTSRIMYNNRPCLMCFFHDTTERREAQEALKRERRTLEHMLLASDHERQLIAYDIHDGLAQQLAAAIMQFQVYDHLQQTQPDKALQAYDGGMLLLRQGHVETRRLISGVRPPILDESGVVAAIAHLIRDPASGETPKVEFRSRVKFRRLAPSVENVIYRIVQEGLNNARTHAQSKKIEVSLLQRDQRLRIEIRDWGVGFNPQTIQENRFGLEGIRERARLLGGKCRIRSKRGKGTSLLVELPVVDHRP